MAEIHLIGSLVGSANFPSGLKSIFCKWSLQTGASWTLLSGNAEGQTQVDEPALDDNFAYWSHPIDVHFATRGLQGWPKLLLQVYHQDQFGRNDLIGYGFCHIPSSPGQHHLDIVTWRPSGSVRDAVSQHFLGGGHQLRSPDLLVANADRHRLTTTAVGKIHLQIGIIARYFDKFGVES